MPRKNPIQRCRAIGVRRGVAMAASLISAGRRIVSITDDGGLTRVITVGPHGLIDFDTITISGNSVSGYNMATTVTSVLDTTTFFIDLAYTSDGVGGYWTDT